MAKQSLKDEIPPPHLMRGRDDIFGAGRAYEIAKDIAFPRATGSDGERQVAEYISKRFRDLGLEVKEEEFTLFFSPWVLLKIGLLISFILLIFSRLLAKHYPVIASLIIFSLMIILLLTGPLWQWFGRRGIKNPWSKEKRSKNIIARLTPPFNSPLSKGGEKWVDPLSKGGERGVSALYLMAHYDSKSQSLSLGGRILLISVSVAGCLFLALAYLLKVTAVQNGIFLFVIFSIVILFLNRTDNLSPGGIDNAGSVGLLLELAEVLTKNPPRNLDVAFIATGAEEEGLMGAYAFLKTHKAELDPERTFILNFDGVGIKGKLRLFSKIKGLPETLNRLRSWPIFSGVMMDHIPFTLAGIKAVTLACVSKKAFRIHTGKDTIDLIAPEGIKESGDIALKVIEELEGD